MKTSESGDGFLKQENLKCSFKTQYLHVCSPKHLCYCRWQHHSQFFSTPPGHHNGFSSPRPQQQRFLPPPASTQSQTARSKMFTPATRSVPTNVAKRPSLQDPLPQVRKIKCHII